MKSIVLDTNVLLVSISSRSKMHWIFENLLQGKFHLCVTTEILAEYAEIIERHMGTEISENVLGIFENLHNIRNITTYFRFGLLNDEDDNKFVDCAIAANAEYIVSHDRDFDILSTINFPSVQVINSSAFKKILNLP